MQVKSKVDLFYKDDIIPAGTILNVELPAKDSPFYEILDGPYKGHQYWIHHFEVLQRKMYTEKEWNELQSKYDRAIDLLTGVTKQIVEKNKEIEKLNFYVSALTIGLTASSEAIQVLREKEKV